MFYEEVFRKLNECNVKYLVAGGLAVNLHGVPRMTQDLDLLVELNEENIMRILKALSEIGYLPRLPVRLEEFADKDIRESWIREKNMKAFTLFHSQKPFQEVDLLFDSPVDYRDAALHMEIRKAGALSIPVVAIDDLIAMKSAAGRKQDLSDIRMLEAIKTMEREDG
ncbi:MAG: nucleotidyl transferase AbiEii/AbiGii toxin family protein [Candidatus Xenobiia bacterium LiM19]